MLDCKPRRPPRSAGASGSEDHAPLQGRRVMGWKSLGPYSAIQSNGLSLRTMTLSQLQGMPSSFKDIDLHVGLVWEPPKAEITHRTAPST
jgi:hypothetical protein